MRLRLHTALPNGHVTEANVKPYQMEGYEDWLEWMLNQFPDHIFFYTVDSTDIFEDDIDLNTMVMLAHDGTITHTFSPKCPPGCQGQFENCFYTKE